MLRCRDSNPDLLSNNQVFFRLNDIGSSYVVPRQGFEPVFPGLRVRCMA
jgi:hypothetical protein